MEESNFFAGDYSGAGELYFAHQKPTDFIYNNNQFTIDDLLVDFPSNDDVALNDAFFDNVNGNSTDSSTVTAVDSCNSSVSGNEAPFSGNVSSESQFSGVEICLPHDDLAELEWLSSFTHDSSFSTAADDGCRDLKLISSAVTETPATATSSSHTKLRQIIFQPEVFVPGKKSRSKRSRIAPCDWTSRILHLKPTTSFPEPPNGVKRRKPSPLNQRRRHREVVLEPSRTTTTIRCLHCGSDTTPQWRSGPMGPKTLCNACGVRFKSGRLVPEYRPAASPTYVSAKHSNSHRKVMEIRRQKEVAGRSSGLGGSEGGDEGCLIDGKSGTGFYAWN